MKNVTQITAIAKGNLQTVQEYSEKKKTKQILCANAKKKNINKKHVFKLCLTSMRRIQKSDTEKFTYKLNIRARISEIRTTIQL